MRVNHPFRYLFVFIVLSVSIYSCERGNGPYDQPCLTVICRNGNFTNEGVTCVCHCTPGFKGPTCDSAIASGFIGKFTCSSQSCTSGFSSLVLQITANAYAGDKLNIANLHGAGGTTIASIDSLGNALSITAQPLSGSTIFGSATLSGSVLTINYVITNGVTRDSCTGVFLRQ